MLNEQPRLIFLQFWANDEAVKLARGLRAALGKTLAPDPAFKKPLSSSCIALST
jgi:hypothetical protein